MQEDSLFTIGAEEIINDRSDIIGSKKAESLGIINDDDETQEIIIHE